MTRKHLQPAIDKKLKSKVFRMQIPDKTGYKYRKEQNGTIIINNIYVGTLIFLNPFAARIFEMCNGNKSILDIQNETMIQYWFLESEHLETEVLNSIRTLARQRSIRFVPEKNSKQKAN